MKRKREERRRRRRLTVRTIFMLSLTLIFNTYAWFLYITTVSTNMQVHVDAWGVNFEVDGTVIEKDFILAVDHAYPGMEGINKTVTITNNGEKVAEITYKIASLRVLDKTYVVESELTSEEKAALTGSETKITEEEMTRMLEEDFPFQISVVSSSNELDINEEATVTMSFTWAYESGDDELDTQYGVDSYKYYEDNEGEPAIQAKIKLKAQQKQ